MAAVNAEAAAQKALEAAVAALPKPVVLQIDMPAEARDVVFAEAGKALVQQKVEKDQAMQLKKALENWNGGLWHVIIGTSFGASVAYETHLFVLFRIGKMHVLAFQSFDELSLVQPKQGGHVARAVKKKEDEDDGPADS